MIRVVEAVKQHWRFSPEDRDEILRTIVEINPVVDLTKPRDEQYLWVTAVIDSVADGVWQPRYAPGEREGAGRLKKMAKDINGYYANAGSAYYLKETGYAWKSIPPVFTWMRRGDE